MPGSLMQGDAEMLNHAPLKKSRLADEVAKISAKINREKAGTEENQVREITESLVNPAFKVLEKATRAAASDGKWEVRDCPVFPAFFAGDAIEKSLDRASRILEKKLLEEGFHDLHLRIAAPGDKHGKRQCYVSISWSTNHQ